MSQDGAQDRITGGSLAGGRYQLRELLGQGGMASVHLAYDSALDRRVAIKTLHTELGREQSFRERFRREAQAVAKLSHPHIVSVFDTGEDTVFFEGADAPSGPPMPYIVMEYVEGAPLGSVLHDDVRRYGAMPAEKALAVTAEVLAALESSHDVGLVHRDIKPGNVMLTRRGAVKVMDFGIARAMQSGVTSMTQTGMVVGTPQYLSPEQALGRGVDARSDLYSVGVMLFQLLTGRLPFDADAPLAIVYAHVQEEPPVPSSVNRSLTPAMDALVARALKKNPNERFPGAAAMRAECLRVAAAGRTAAPVIVAGAPAASGSGVGSAVFPPVGQQPQQGFPGQAPGPASGQAHGQTSGPLLGQPQPSHGQTHGQPAPVPYQPGPYGPPAPHSPAPQHPTPYAPAHGYGYPQGSHTAQPSYAVAPSPSAADADGRKKRRTRKLLLGFFAFSLAMALLFGGAEKMLRGFGDDDPSGSGKEPAASRSAQTDAAGGEAATPPDRSRTIDPEKCTDPLEDGRDPAKVQAPSLKYKDVRSVKECLRAAGWTWDEKKVDTPQWPEDAVVQQYPREGTAVTPGKEHFELEISTGRSG